MKCYNDFMNKNRILNEVLFVNFAILFVYFLTSLLQFLFSYFNFQSSLNDILSLALAAGFIIYLHNHISYKNQRVTLLIVGILIFVFIFLRILKYRIFERVEVVARHLWYLFYLPTLFIPFHLFISSLSNNAKLNQKKFFYIRLITFLITLLLFLFVITNDLHQLAFGFNPNFENWNYDYSHNFIYYIIVVWDTLLLLFSFSLSYLKSRIFYGRKYAWLSLIPLFLGSLWLIGDVLKILPQINEANLLNSFAETFCYMIAGYIFASIKLGLITTNENYHKLFFNMQLPAYILDNHNNIIYKSALDNKFSSLNLPNKNSKIIEGNYVIKNISILGGSSIWFEDLSEINNANKQLKELKSKLQDEERLYELINKLKEEQISTSEKNALYDLIAHETLKESERINELTREVELGNSKFKNNMLQVCILSVFIKRFANLKFETQVKKNVNSYDLFLAMKELSIYLEKYGIKITMSNHKNEFIDGEILIEAYKLFKDIVMNNLDNLSNVYIKFDDNDNKLYKLVIEAKTLQIPNKSRNLVDFKYIFEDKICYFSVYKKEINL